jgi:microsomal dipeptidase-like Zn-dependent dipeptidase
MLSLGALYEFCVNGFLPESQRMSPRKMMEIVAEAGSDHVVMTTDYFNEWEPPGAEMLRMLIGTMLSAGMHSEDLRKMVNSNPRRLLAIN